MKYFAIAAICLAGLTTASTAHDTWVETNTNVVRVGDAVHIAFKLGNHGNDHRDFKLAGKPKLESSTLSVLTPDGSEYDLRPSLIDEGYTPNEGFFSTRFVTAEAGLFQVSHRSDAVVSYAPKRSVKSAKVFFVASKSLDKVPQDHAGFDRVLGHELELILRTNPVTPMGPGQPLAIELRYKGQPLPDARVSFIPRGVDLKAEFDPAHEQLTNAEGISKFEPKGGNVYLVVAHHEEPDEAGEGYTSTKYSATMTLFVPEVCPCCGE